MNSPVCGFFAYPSTPASIPEVIQNAVEKINRSRELAIKTWETCSVSGKIIIDVICSEINAADFFLADLTGANPNVLFELGYAIGRKKRVWVLLDTSLEESRMLFDKLEMLTTLGYSPYSNSRNIIDNFYKDQPWTDLNDTIFKQSIEPALSSRENSGLLYLKTQFDTEASRLLSRTVDTYSLPKTLSDPNETSAQTLFWYARKIWYSLGVIAHLSGLGRRGHRLHNSRYAFLSGLAHGLEKPLLMLAEFDYPTPIDYRNILQKYNTAAECENIARTWLDSISSQYASDRKESGDYAKKVALAVDLRSLDLGEYLAENEEEVLHEYFVETQPFLGVLDGQHTIVIGRKGSGKTANLYMAAERLGKDKRNLVCVIKPVSYDVQGIVRLGKQIAERDQKGYLAQALWKFMIISEIARVAYEETRKLPYVDSASPEGQLKTFVEGHGSLLQDNFAVRLERCVSDISKSSPKGSISKFQGAVSELIHDGVLRDLRRLLGDMLTKRTRVAILIDNLDKAWDRREDLEHLSDFLFGLIRIAGDVPRDFSKQDHWRKPVNVSIALFLRSDIFTRVMKNAREPDKLMYERMAWEDGATLMRVIDERLSTSRGGEDPGVVWEEVFRPTVRNVSTRDYILSTILPRPRDLVFFAKAALSTAVNRGHGRVEEEDFAEAEKQYSFFVFEGIQVENGISLPELEAIMFEFVGRSTILTRDEVLSIVVKSGIEDNRREYALQHLVSLSFLGVEVSPDKFRYSLNAENIQKLVRLSERYIATSSSEPRYRIHNAFHAYLEVS